MRLLVAIVLAGTVLLPSSGRAATTADSSAIRQIALDYIEGWYAGDAERVDRVTVEWSWGASQSWDGKDFAVDRYWRLAEGEKEAKAIRGGQGK